MTLVYSITITMSETKITVSAKAFKTKSTLSFGSTLFDLRTILVNFFAKIATIKPIASKISPMITFGCEKRAQMLLSRRSDILASKVCYIAILSQLHIFVNSRFRVFFENMWICFKQSRLSGFFCAFMADICQLPGESARGSALGAERRRKILLCKIFAFARGGPSKHLKKTPEWELFKAEDPFCRTRKCR